MAFLTRGVCLPWIFRVSWQTNHQPAHVHYDMSANLALRFFIQLHLLHACAAWPEQLKRAPRQLQHFPQQWRSICPTGARPFDVSKAHYLLCGQPLPRAACQRNCKEEGTVHGMLGSTGSCQVMLFMPMVSLVWRVVGATREPALRSSRASQAWPQGL